MSDPSNYQGSGGAYVSKEKFATRTEAPPKNITITDTFIFDTSKSFFGHVPISAFFTDTPIVNLNRSNIHNEIVVDLRKIYTNKRTRICMETKVGLNYNKNCNRRFRI